MHRLKPCNHALYDTYDTRLIFFIRFKCVFSVFFPQKNLAVTQFFAYNKVYFYLIFVRWGGASL